MEDFSGSGESPNSTVFRCGLPPFFPPALGIHDSINKIQATIAILTATVGLPLNIYLFIIILKYKSLHQRSLFLSLQIIAIEIVYHAVVPATILTSGITGTWIFGEVFCNITGMIHDAFAMFRFSMTLVLTVDRFIYIFQPFFYSKHGGKLAWLLSSCMWFLSLVRVIVPLYGVLDCYSYIPTFKTCTAFSGCSKPCEYFVAVSITFIISTGVIIPMILYAIIFIKVRQVTRQHENNLRQHENNSENANRAFRRLQQRKKILITVFLLMVSIAGGTAPAFTLYIISLFYRVANATIFIVNMLIGRTFFNLIPVFDAIAFTRHGDVKHKSTKLIRSMSFAITSTAI
jgi:uncharacterized membrane protein YciS (DUF1049 family)